MAGGGVIEAAFENQRGSYFQAYGRRLNLRAPMSPFPSILLALALSLCSVVPTALATVIGQLVEVSDSHHSSRSHSTYERHGRIKRSAAAKDEFKKRQTCPSTGKSRGACPGYVIDHVVPLACGGADAPSNMQWQTIAEGKAKDKVERKNCRR